MLPINRVVAAVSIAALAYFGGGAAALLWFATGESLLGTLARSFAWIVALPSIILRLLLPFLSDRLSSVLGAITWGIVFYAGRTLYLRREARRLTSA